MTTYIIAMLQVLTGRIEKSDRGATAVEYGIMVALIAVIIITAVALIGTNLSTMFDNVAGKIK